MAGLNGSVRSSISLAQHIRNLRSQAAELTALADRLEASIQGGGAGGDQQPLANPRRRRPYRRRLTKQEWNRLVAMSQAGHSGEEMALNLGRTRQQIYTLISRARVKGLLPPRESEPSVEQV